MYERCLLTTLVDLGVGGLPDTLYYWMFRDRTRITTYTLVNFGVTEGGIFNECVNQLKSNRTKQDLNFR